MTATILYLFGVLLISTAMVGGAQGACDIVKVTTDCLPQINEIASMMGGAMQNKDVLNQMCGKVEGIGSCYDENTRDCEESQKASLETAMAGFEMYKQKCDPNNPCSFFNTFECLKDAPMSESEINYAESCKVLPKVMSCMNNLKTQCSNDETIKMMVGGSSDAFNQADTECKRLYGPSYATDMQTEPAEEVEMRGVEDDTMVGNCTIQDVSVFVEKCTKPFESMSATDQPFQTLASIEDPFTIWVHPNDVCINPEDLGKLGKCIFKEYETCHKNTTKASEMAQPIKVEMAIVEMCNQRALLFETVNKTEVTSCVTQKRSLALQCVEKSLMDNKVLETDNCLMAEQLESCLAVMDQCTAGEPIFAEYTKNFVPESCDGAGTILPSALALLAMAVLATLFHN